jgi:hypothetical protein
MATAEIASIKDFLEREYLSSLRQFPEGTQQLLLRGSSKTVVRTKDPSKTPPSAPVSDVLPMALQFLGGHLCDLGFDKLDLSPTEIDRIYLAFASEGVALPGTSYKLRHSVMSMFTFVEPADGGEVTLPLTWRQTVRSEKWLGKKIDAVEADLSQYEEEEDGYLLKKT